MRIEMTAGLPAGLATGLPAGLATGLRRGAAVGALLATAMASTPALCQESAISFAEDAEYQRSAAADLVGAGAAHARGWTGAGVTVAVFDTGISGWSSELRGSLVTGYDAVTGRLMRQSYDVGWHGTFVAGLIAAARDGSGIEGIAYDASLLPIRIGNADGSITLTDRQLAAGIRYATGRASVFNNSWNTTATVADTSAAALAASLGASIAAWRSAVAAGTIVVWAAGNEGAAEPGVLGALPTYWADLADGWVVAVSVDSAGVISSFSNRCGSAAAWCIAAPGEDVVSVYAGGVATASGTSFAAPVVSAAAAVLQQMWPHLSNAQVLEIMFTTADKSGIYADAATYGQGLLDLEAATRPVGTTGVATGATVSDARTTAATSLLASSGAYGRSLARLLGGTRVMVLDAYDRDFYTDGDAFVATAGQGYDAFHAVQGFGRPFATVTAGPVTMAVAPSGESDGGGPGRFVARVALDRAGTRTVAVSRGVSSALLMPGTASDTTAQAMLADPRTVQSPFLSLGFGLDPTTRDAWGAAYTTALGSAHGAPLALTVAGFGTAVADRPGEWSHASLTTSASQSTTAGAVARLTLGGPARRLAIDVGMVRETGTLLGAASDGALRLADGADTGFVGLSADVALGAGWTLFAGAEAGGTRARAASGSLVSDVGPLLTTAYRLGVARDGLLADGDRAVLTVSQPLRIASGTLALSVPVGRTDDGAVVRLTTAGDAGADGREIDLQAGYTVPVLDRASVTLSGLVRFSPDNVAGATPEGVALARWRMAF